MSTRHRFYRLSPFVIFLLICIGGTAFEVVRRSEPGVLRAALSGDFSQVRGGGAWYQGGR